MDFEDYCQNYKEQEEPNDVKQNFNDTSEQKMNEDIKEKLEKYKSLDNNQLLAELLKEVNKQKQSGNLTNEKLDDMVNEISGFLDEEQKKRLQNIIKILR